MLDTAYWRAASAETVLSSGEEVLFDDRAEVLIENKHLEGKGVPVEYRELQGYVMHVEMERALQELCDFINDHDCDYIDEVMVIRECLEKLKAKHGQ